MLRSSLLPCTAWISSHRLLRLTVQGRKGDCMPPQAIEASLRKVEVQQHAIQGFLAVNQQEQCHAFHMAGREAK